MRALAPIPVVLETIRFSHSIFALPFALVGALLAARGWPDGRTLLLLVACVVAARSAAMGWNRLADRELDARNPRTASRALPAGRISPRFVRLFVAGNALAFLLLASALSPLCGALALPVLGLLLGYSHLKRRVAGTHFVLGAALGVAPLGAWLAVRGSFEGDLASPLLLALAVALWVAGFDLIYACQDVAFDRREGLRSIPARLGVAGALRLSSALHAAVVPLLLAVAARAGLGAPTYAGIGLVAALLLVEHLLVRPRDLSRVNAAFFTVNGWISVAFFLAVWADFAFRGKA
ncbi:MAG TPA: UbiA-like polyprenyltransferase [Planctomycetota bacterium]|jgi:4-hydroxybenzoate polyprenyltransferase|nr:UbiA-like polyprenyltransferase [Planctomycetota bacterium]